MDMTSTSAQASLEAGQPGSGDIRSLVQPTTLCQPDWRIPAWEREILRGLAGQAAELAARPIELEKQRLWQQHNDLQPTRPVIFCDPENSWNEVLLPRLVCTSPLGREWEWQLRRTLFWGQEMLDDFTIQPFFDISHRFTGPDWGLQEVRTQGAEGGSYVWEAPVKLDTDLMRLHDPILRVDFAATQQSAELAHAIFGDLLTVRVKTAWWWTVGLTQTLVYLRGMAQIMYDITDNPALFHRMMAILQDGSLHLLESLETQGLLYPNWEGSYVGSGGLGWTQSLPAEGYTPGKVRLRDLWVLSESQETVGISPRMFAEFIFPYQLPIIERFGLSCYGCCEPVDKRWPTLRKIPNLRRVSVSPWSNRAVMAEALGDQVVLSMKPNPADLAMETFDEERIRAGLRADLWATRDCRVEVIMKDNHTIRNDPTRLTRWVQIVRQEIERL